MSGQVSRFYALKKSIEPEGVGLNHTHSSFYLPFTLNTHTHTRCNTKSTTFFRAEERNILEKVMNLICLSGGKKGHLAVAKSTSLSPLSLDSSH